MEQTKLSADADKVIANLSLKLGDKERQIAVLETFIQDLQQKLSAQEDKQENS